MAIQDKIDIKPLHPTFAAEISGIDWNKPIPPYTIAEIQSAIDTYGVLVFRAANLDDDAHVAFAQQFGKLEPTPAASLGVKTRLPSPYIGDLANVDHQGNLKKYEDKLSRLFAKGNETWHADMQYHPRRCKYSTLRAVKLPPKGIGGESLYADSRQAYNDLSPEMKQEVDNRVAYCSLLHNRRDAAPELYQGVDVMHWPDAKWKLVYAHENTGRMNLYVTSYMHKIEGLSQAEGDKPAEHAAQPRYIHTVFWENDGDMVMWDNTAVLCKATDGAGYIGKHVRDVRRTSCFDDGKYAWGGNDPENPWIIKLPKDPFAVPTAQ
ncbi:hypothetical protein LTR10_024250 [Elasticomyces elasticus]|uniref:TauD/TfdA-like domain-containing protein n=1 Tax=Exophiala sideris TaxID=1016849 RepID=A0ABR0IU89_9EURO|nr:hypothetical protein LTR10_024250 [Elasticomyces elasticus]KAK5020848.1 hypothetical protein LTS07_011399 [Exophiala sideris]KAK5022842.1 hypothetical protein LTR13_011406 [Exophiala sideris]KAK5048387.1 hypothetical protein LTR69_011413 [Exophiala sideris]KAK5176015.1 hypothetical protein LTR44_011422 [Eurotiomycetes sp. CCFEE 6388]